MKKIIAAEIHTVNVQNITPKKCLSISGRSQLTYETGEIKEGTPVVRILRSDMGGTCNSAWFSVSEIMEHMEHAGEKFCSRFLMIKFKGMSNNIAPFILSVLRNEGLVDLIPGQKPWKPHMPRWCRLAN